MKTQKNLNVAFVYDRVNTPFGGAERVLIALHKLFPNAPLYTSVYDADKAKWASVFSVKTSFLQHIPFAKQYHRQLLPLMLLAFRQFDFSGFDVVISISSAEAKAVRIFPPTFHLCYLLTPPRYLWSHTHEYQTGPLKFLKAIIFSKFRGIDFQTTQSIDMIIPISYLIKKRAEKYYKRSISAVIYPPFLTLPSPSKKPNLPTHFEQFFLVVARLVSYKKVTMAARTCINMKQPLIIVGKGPDEQSLENLLQELDAEHKTVLWFRTVSDEKLASLYQECTGFLLPAEEDFGITALEAQAYGKPVVVYHRSGAAEVVIDGVTGIHIHEQTQSALEQGIKVTLRKKWDSNSIKKHAKAYNEENFLQQFQAAFDRMLLTE